MTRTVFDPTVPQPAQAFAYAPRPPSLYGLRVGLVENTKINSAVILRKVAQRLEAGYHMTMVHLERKRSPGHSVSEEALALFRRKTDFVISGVGD
jgi:hypothetical protein